MTEGKANVTGDIKRAAKCLFCIVIAQLLTPAFRDPVAVAAASPLDRAVGLQLRYASVGELCKGLTTEQVSFVPATTEIGDYKVHALFRDCRLKEVMVGVTQLFSLPDGTPGLYWRKELGRERLTYQLAARPDFARRLAEARRKPWEQLRRRLELLRDWPGLSPEQRVAAAGSHPVVARQARLAWDPALVRLFWSNPQAAALLSGDPVGPGRPDRVTLRYRDADPEMQRLLAGLRESFLANSTGGEGRPAGALEDTVLEFRTLPDSPTVMWRLQSTTGRAFFGEIGSPTLRLSSGTLTDSPDALPTSRSGCSGVMASERDGQGRTDRQATDKDARIDYLFEALRALQSPGPVSFLTHARTVPAAPYALPGTGSLESRLDGVGKQFLYRFHRSGPLVLGEDTRWVLDHEAEVPIRLLLDWAEKKQRRGRLDLDELAEMTRFSQERWTRLRITFPELRGGSRLLAVWAALSPAQRRAAWSPTGLVLRQIPDLESVSGSILRVEYSDPALQAGSPSVPRSPEAVIFSVENPNTGARSTESSPLPPPEPQFRVEDIRK